MRMVCPLTPASVLGAVLLCHETGDEFAAYAGIDLSADGHASRRQGGVIPIIDDYAAIAARMRELRDGPARHDARLNLEPLVQHLSAALADLEERTRQLAQRPAEPAAVSAAWVTAREEIGLIESSFAARPTIITPEALEAWQAGILEAVEHGLRRQNNSHICELVVGDERGEVAVTE